MSSDISIDEQFLWISNHRLRSMIAFVLEVAIDTANTKPEKDYVAKLTNWREKMYWPGCSANLHERFPSVDEKKFWSRCFFKVGHRIFRRELGNRDIQSWQCSAISTFRPDSA